MTTLVVGDVHLKSSAILPLVDDAIAARGVSRAVFVGDYCDDWDATPERFEREVSLLVDWTSARRADGLAVDLLFGNHDFQYLLGGQGPGTLLDESRFVRETLFPLGLRIATTVDGWLVTHAGLAARWVALRLPAFEGAEGAADALNALLDDGSHSALRALYEAGAGRGGRGVPGPLWADRTELELDAVPGIGQIVGHSPVRSAHSTKAAAVDAGGERPALWFCDTFSTTSWGRPIGDSSLLLVDGGEVSAVDEDAP